ncbi:hypothetical protein ScalyP_jg9310 [Parmales sp. scaly parma]|nr:hypothetical protein ScalyP_jg9310 [Parmales sp. scaly parma]
MQQAQTDQYLSAVLQSSGSHPQFLETLFSFLHRRTDFYVIDDVLNFKNGTARMGFPKGRALEMVKEAMANQKFKESLTELTVYIPNLPPKTTSKCCKIAIKPSSLSVIVSDRKLLVGEFERKVNLSECIWSLDKEANTLQINLEKVEKTWWASPTKEDLYKIDCGKVDSTMRVDEYDESTQGKIREIMYQQNEERRKIASGEVQPPIPPHLADRERDLSLD